MCSKRRDNHSARATWPESGKRGLGDGNGNGIPLDGIAAAFAGCKRFREFFSLRFSGTICSASADPSSWFRSLIIQLELAVAISEGGGGRGKVLLIAGGNGGGAVAGWRIVGGGPHCTWLRGSTQLIQLQSNSWKTQLGVCVCVCVPPPHPSPYRFCAVCCLLCLAFDMQNSECLP